LAKAHQWQEVERFATSISRQFYRDQVFFELATALAKVYQWQEAERIVASIGDVSQQALASYQVAILSAKMRRSQTQNWWQEAEKAAAVCRSAWTFYDLIT